MIITGILIVLFFSYAAFVSFQEKKKKASANFMAIGISSSLLYIFIATTSFHNKQTVEILLLSVPFIILFIFLIPIRLRNIYHYYQPNHKIDERDTMFSRNELVKGTKNYTNYYSQKPAYELGDNKLKLNAGLLKKGSANYNPYMFYSAEASFFTIESLKNKVDGAIAQNQTINKPQEITNYIVKWSKKLGALNTGITLLKDYHKYSYRGRMQNYGNPVINDHKYAIAFTVEMDFNQVQSAPMAPIVMESAQQYLNSGSIAVQIAEFIRRLGYSARAHIDGNYEVVCPLVARDAGLGEIGRMGLLMTPKEGPRVRIGVVTTDLPLEINVLKFDRSIIEFCSICKKCADCCPSNSISFNSREKINGVIRWQIDQQSCFDFWTKTGTDCGRCVSVCPYSHPNNLLHNTIRFGIKNSSIFSRLALIADNIIYGKKPPVKEPDDWMNIY